MPALGAFSHGEIFFILQEEAEMSLQDYLNGPRPGHSNSKFETPELWKQVAGIAEALSILHKANETTKKIAYHRDLKPANILIHRGILKLADFGLLEWEPDRSGTDSSSPGVVHGLITGYYAAPGKGGKYRSMDDIWSLAAIMSELATFEVQGILGLKNYRKDRVGDFAGQSSSDTQKFWLENNQGIKSVKQSVIKKHNELADCAKAGHSPLYTLNLNDFQKRFYNREFFALIDSMLRYNQRSNRSTLQVPENQATIAPGAREIYDRIMELVKTAYQTPLPINPSIPVPDIWEYTRAGKLKHDSGDPHCRL
jgi:serine/threonine protein kinase